MVGLLKYSFERIDASRLEFIEEMLLVWCSAAKTMRRLLRKSSELSCSERATVLWILTAGLYPQVALSDTHNSFKKDSDQLFHTDAKGNFDHKYPMTLLFHVIRLRILKVSLSVMY